MERWKGQSRDGNIYTFDGSPADVPSFHSWVPALRGKREAGILMDGELVFFKRVLYGEFDPSKPCTTGCKQAKGEYCRCSCGGKNHGIENRDMTNAIQEEEVIWVGAP